MSVDTTPLLEVVAGSESDPSPDSDAYFDIQTLIKYDPCHVVKIIQTKGLKKLGTFEVKDDRLLAALNGRPMLTWGSETPINDYEAMWKERLDKLAPSTGEETWGARLTVAAYIVTIKNAAEPDEKGLLQPLLKRWQAKSLADKVFSLPTVSSVINFKWDHFAARLLLVELTFFLIWLLSYNVFTFLVQDEKVTFTLPELLATTTGKIEVALEILALVGMFPFLIIEISTILAYGGGWFSAWNFLDILTYINQIAITVMHLERSMVTSGVFTVCMAAQAILLWFRLQYFSRVFRPTNFAFLDALTAVIEMTKWYFFFTMLMLWGFGQAFYILYRLDQKHTDEFDGLGSTMLTMFKWMLSGADLDIVSKASSPGVTLVCVVLFQLVMSMLLLNMLLGVMMNAVTKVDEGGMVLHYVSKAQVIDELEATLPAWMETLLGCWSPQFVHVLKLDPNSEGVDLILGEDDRYAIEEEQEQDDEDGDKEEPVEVSKTSNAGSVQDISTETSVKDEIKELKALVQELQAQLTEVSNVVVGQKSKSGRWL